MTSGRGQLATDSDKGDEFADLAYYYPEPYWAMSESDSVKTLLLFFDGVAILLPRYMHGQETQADPVVAGPMRERGLLRVLEPETFVDQEVSERLADAMVDLITKGAFDDLERGKYYHALSQSRMGWDADVQLAEMLIEELRSRDLARPSEDGVSVPLHPVVRQTVLVLLSQLSRDAGRRAGLQLHPTTSQHQAVDGLLQTLSLSPMPSAGHVVTLDLQAVGLNLAPVPLEEILQFRDDYGADYRAYARNVRSLISELSLLGEDERQQRLLDRREELADTAHSLSTLARKEWRLPLASFAIGAAGAVWAVSAQNDPVGAAFSLAAGVLSSIATTQPTAGAYTYITQAQRLLGSR